MLRPPMEKAEELTVYAATRVIPQNRFVDRVTKKSAEGTTADGTSTSATASSSASGSNKTTTQTSFDDAAAMCRAKVAKIVKECRRVNKKYRDPHFDLESDLKLGRRDTLESLGNIRGARKPPGSDFCPRSAKRVTEIFDKPQFYIEGPTANDVRQGRDGDCWLMSALCTLSNKKGLIERLCVAHDQAVGVYGFVFHRDGEWISEIVDDFVSRLTPSPLALRAAHAEQDSSTSQSPTTTRATPTGSSSTSASASTPRRRTAESTSLTVAPCTLPSASILRRLGFRS